MVGRSGSPYRSTPRPPSSMFWKQWVCRFIGSDVYQATAGRCSSAFSFRHVARRLQRGDWVYYVRQPMPEIYLSLVRAVHRRGDKVAASWMFAPEFLPPPLGRVGRDVCEAVRETDAVISVAKCTKHQFREVYGYGGPVAVARYHNIERFATPVSLPHGPPYQIGFMGRIDIHQKNLDTILAAFGLLAARRSDVILNMHGGGNDLDRLATMVATLFVGSSSLCMVVTTTSMICRKLSRGTRASTHGYELDQISGTARSSSL